MKTSKEKIIKNKIFTLLLFCIGLTGLQAQTVTDIDSNVYNTVTIGTQTWLKENLKVTKYRNGDKIPNVTDNKQWGALRTGAYCDYDNISNNNTIYGRLYNCFTVVDSRNLCPTGWHVPTETEWKTLIKYLGGEEIAGGKLKSATGWFGPNTEATNSSGFTGLPGGQRTSDGTFRTIGNNGGWWSTTKHMFKHAFNGSVNTYGAYIDNCDYDKMFGLSVRCIKDK